MKKLLLIILAIIFCQFGHSSNLSFTDKEKIDIEEQPKGELEKDRSIKFIECYISRTENYLELEHSGIGSPIITILDNNGEIVSRNSASCISDRVIINLPQLEGIYRVIIQSYIYYGEGVFYIF